MIKEILKNAAMVGLGIMSLSEEKLKEVIKEMESRGEVSKKEGEEIIKDLLKKIEEERKAVENRMAAALKNSFAKMNIATRGDLVKLEKRVHNLEKKVKELMQERED
ncbi:MAG: hypothetical protein A2073_00150 [Deltaproteobacteria bacterium GWC2_42_11]|nr:MAG: hypothetical protein A2073_00150 [Deltaproteobacteria bacterium GWC2_42_11]HBO84509.1 hypothetical protein [Deltaproteobacteria bacterium]